MDNSIEEGDTLDHPDVETQNLEYQNTAPFQVDVLWRFGGGVKTIA